jgi:hypothetical protein
MELDLETFLTTLYVMTDDLYQACIRPMLPNTGGPEPKLSDAEVLCLGLAAQWHVGVPWDSERSFVRYALKHLRPLFPGMTSQSAFNRRLRRLWGAFLLLQQALVGLLAAPPLCEIVDSVPVRVASGARRFKPGWLAGIAHSGKGGTDGFFFGLRLLVAITPDGLVTGWTMGSAKVQEHWLLELMLSTRRGQPQFGRIPSSKKDGPPRPPQEWLAPFVTAGPLRANLVLGDLGFIGENWQGHWLSQYDVAVQTSDTLPSGGLRRWFHAVRHDVETAFAHLDTVFGLEYPNAHTTWGLITRIAAKMAAYNLGVQINRLLERPDFSFASLVV